MDSPTSPTDAQPEDGKALEGGAELEPSDKQAAQVFESALEPEPQVRIVVFLSSCACFVPSGRD